MGSKVEKPEQIGVRAEAPVAHTDREHIAIEELNRAVDIYEKLAATLLASP